MKSPRAEQGLVVGTLQRSGFQVASVAMLGTVAGRPASVRGKLASVPGREVVARIAPFAGALFLVVADRHADQQGRQVVDQQQPAQAVVGASAKVQRAEADGALLQRLEQGLVARRGR